MTDEHNDADSVSTPKASRARRASTPSKKAPKADDKPSTRAQSTEEPASDSAAAATVLAASPKPRRRRSAAPKVEQENAVAQNTAPAAGDGSEQIPQDKATASKSGRRPRKTAEASLDAPNADLEAGAKNVAAKTAKVARPSTAGIGRQGRTARAGKPRQEEGTAAEVKAKTATSAEAIAPQGTNLESSPLLSAPSMALQAEREATIPTPVTAHAAEISVETEGASFGGTAVVAADVFVESAVPTQDVVSTRPAAFSRQDKEISSEAVVDAPLVVAASDSTGRGKVEAEADNATAATEFEGAEGVDVTSAQADNADESGTEAPRKSRRGRRGGRGRRGKGRAVAVEDTGVEALATEALQKAEQGSEEVVAGEISQPADAREMGTARSSRGKKTPMAVAAVAKKGRNESPEARIEARSDNKVDAKGDRKADADVVAHSEVSSESKSEARAEGKPGRRKMFISVVPGEQVEVALVEDGGIHEYYLEMLHQAKTKGNIYKGVVHNVDTNLQAAFVSYGVGKNGFLQIDEIHPEYFLSHHEPMKGKKFPPIQKVIKPGQEVLVQVVKEPTGNKGAFLTTWLSLAGRFLVLTPGQEQIGVSRKVDNDEERARLREMMNGIEPGEGLGVIVRTVSAGTSKTTLKNDLQYLKRVWKEIRKRGTTENTPALIYQEFSLAERAVRDYLTDDVCEVWVDNETVAESLRETVALLFPRKKDLVRVHADVRQTLWERFNIQRQLEQIYSREVSLPSGGRLVFDQTEALMAIDINSGKISGKGNFESMALKTNLEAAETIARHLKLRDIGGQVVIDFIEMRDKNHVRDVEKTLRNAMKNDRARHDVARMSSFGLLEIVRQRTGSSALAITMEPCPACGGTGIRRNLEWQALQAMREIGRQGRSAPAGKCVFEASTELGMYLLNHKRDRLREMEQQMQISIEIRLRP